MRIIKLLLVSAIILTLSFSSFAGGKYGLRAGYQLSNVYNGNTALNANGLNSFYAGMFTEQEIAPLLFFGSGSEYSQIGAMTNADNKLVMHYVGIPTYLKLKIGPVYAIAGATANFLVWEQHFYKDAPLDPYDNAGWFDIPVFASLGVQISEFRLDARYNWGTFDLYKAPNDGYKNQFLQLGVAVAL